MDNLNTHGIAALYETFPPEAAKRIRDRLEIHYPPKQGSWLNLAVIEINVLANHGLSSQVATIEQMKQEEEAWSRARNKRGKKTNWRFTTKEARIKLRRLYALFEP
jgi:hypothetical protein